MRPTAVQLNTIGSYESGIMCKSPAKIVAYHADSRRILTVNAQSGRIKSWRPPITLAPTGFSGFHAFDGLDAELDTPVRSFGLGTTA
ncbi:hypothetical protein D9542_05650 [Corynebacterium macginleyi]|nr:hypothetical protein D9542_05650 [Corynebacterium macginleyi]